jgi:magnesium-transporting ATPase (P-type)
MEELDLLKNNWKKTTDFQQVSEENIYGMIHKKSTSIVKWILIISVLEFFVSNTIAYFLPEDKKLDEIIKIHPYLVAFDYLYYSISVIFIIIFYKNYKLISSIQDSKSLIKNILNTRKIVSYYIFCIIIISCNGAAFSFLEGWYSNGNEFNPFNSKSLTTIQYFIIVLVMVFIAFIMWGFYMILFGNLLNKLKQNFKELNSLDS